MFRKPENKGIDERLFEAIINANRECSYHNMIKMYVTALGSGEAILEIVIEQEHLNPRNIAHGGITFSLADTAMGMVIRTFNYDSVTVASNINFLKPVYKNDTLKAVGKIVDLGKKIMIVRAEVVNQKKEKIAVARGTFYKKGEFLVPEA